MERSEAIKIVREYYPSSGKDLNEALETLIPELKESEDEKIRKALIRGIESVCKEEEVFAGGFTRKQIVSWLEKQGGQPKKVSIWKHWKNGIAGNGEGTPVYLIKDGYTYSISSCLCFECDYIELSELDKLLSEKQGEQKPATDLVEEPDFFDDFRNTDSEIEPKFRNGQWIVWQNKCYKVNCNGCGYELIDQNGLSTSLEYGTVEESAHLWDITKDAKNGDALINWNNTAFIFKTIEDETVKFHIAYNEKWEAIKTPSTTLSHMGLPESQFEFHPATKEQCDLLFAKMKEAGYEWNVEKKELKKLDNKVEPKFHEGDWIISDTANKDYHICKITGIKDGNYTIESTCGYKGYNTFETFEKDYHIWTIKDSKNGGVLCSKKHNLIWIYKDNEHYHASINLNYADVVSFDNEIVVPSDVCPANRVQRSILLQKIEEAGYMWDAEKKELKKIEKKPTWTDYDEYVYNEILKRVEKKKLYEHDLEYIYNWLKFIKDRVGCEVNCTTTKQWSEEDEYQINTILHGLDLKRELYKKEGNKVEEERYNTQYNWLKSLKERVQPQNNITDEELAQAKKEAYNEALNKVEYRSGEPTFDDGWSAAIWYLKKRNGRPQNTWKPSDEQMEVLLSEVTAWTKGCTKQIVLELLYNDLKKLKS